MFLLGMALSACTGQNLDAPTAAATNSSTSTPMQVTQTPTATKTSSPTQTPIPQPASLTGTIHLLRDDPEVFPTIIELREPDSFKLVSSSVADPEGVYIFEDLDPGIYQLWVLITTGRAMLPGCGDVSAPDTDWLLGIVFEEDMALTTQNIYLSAALFFAESLDESEIIAQGFYAVLAELDVKSGEEKVQDVALPCY